MNWEAAAAIGEIAAAVGVIVSLIYLAHQVRHGAATARRAAGHEVMMTTTPLLVALATDADVASIWTRGLASYESLSQQERVRFSCLLLLLTYSWDEVQHGHKAKQLDDWAMQRFMGSMHELARLPGFKMWYEARKAWLSDEIREALEREMQGDVHSPLYGGGGSSTHPQESKDMQ